MRILAALLVLSFAASASAQSHRDRVLRALDVIDELKLDDATMAKLLPAVSAYERERDAKRLQQQDLTAMLRVETDPALADKMLDALLAAQGAELAAEAALVTKLRALLPAEQAARARVILLAPTPTPSTEPARRSRRGGDLFPPGSQLSPPQPCDPFASMHGC